MDREVTSQHVVVDIRRPNRRTPMKSRKTKTYGFRWAVWRSWCHQVLESGLADTSVAEESACHGLVKYGDYSSCVCKMIYADCVNSTFVCI